MERAQSETNPRDVLADESIVTMEQVAKRAGVSISTVSRALRNDTRVASTTVDRVRQAASDLDFRPNTNASRLRRRTTQLVALAVPALNDWYFATLMAGAQTVLAANGYDTVVAVTSGPGPLGRILHDATPKVGRVDGVIVVDMNLPDEVVSELVSSETPIVTTGRAFPFFPSVMIDDIEVGRLATAHLIGLGHTSIGLIGGSGNNPYGFAVSERRRKGYHLALAHAGLEPAGTEVSGNFALAGGRDAAADLLGQNIDGLSGIVCMSDKMAIGAMAVMEERGLRVPEDISIIGVDDHELAERFGMTTVRQSVEAMGQAAAELMVEGLTAGKRIPEHRTLATGLVVRRSTGRRRP